MNQSVYNQWTLLYLFSPACSPAPAPVPFQAPVPAPAPDPAPATGLIECLQFALEGGAALLQFPSCVPPLYTGTLKSERWNKQLLVREGKIYRGT